MVERSKIDRAGWLRLQWLSLAAGLLLLSAAGMGYHLHQRALGMFAQITAQGETIDRLHRYLKAALDAETGERGYLLTGNKNYLEPYTKALQTLKALRAELSAPMQSAAIVVQQFLRMEQLLDLRLTELASSIARFEKLPQNEAAKAIFADAGKQLMDQLRAKNDAILDKLGQARLASVDSMLRVRSYRDIAMLTALGLGFALSITAFFVIREHILGLHDEQRSRRQAERAMRDSREKSVFLASMSHEIRTPMNAILGFTQLLTDLVQREPEAHYVRAIQSSGASLLALINDILDLSKIESGKIDLRLEPVSLEEVAFSARSLFSQQALEKKIKLSIDAHGAPEELLLDPLRMRQILCNLVSNALKYSDRGSVSAVFSSAACDAEAEYSVALTLTVSDTGIGLAPEYHQRIFNAFNQVPLQDRDARGGSGLGLSIVRRLMEAMGGTIQVRSALGKGAVFIAIWPKVARVLAAPVIATHAPLEDLNLAAPLRIVAIDDVALNRELLEAYFAGTAHQLRSAASAESGLVMITEDRPDLVFMDIRMPGMDGTEALRVIRADPRLENVRVIAITASTLIDEEQEFRQFFDGYVRKPATRAALLAELLRLFPAAATAQNEAAQIRPDIAQWAAHLALSQTARDELARALDDIAPQLKLARGTFSSAALAQLQRKLLQLPESVLGFVQADARALGQAREAFDLERIGACLALIEQKMQQLLERVNMPHE